VAKKIYSKNFNEEKKNFVKSYLKKNCLGRDNSIHYKQSKELFEIHSRQMALIITELRNEGFPVCSHNVDGIWWAKDKDELLVTLNFLNSRINVLNSNVNGLKKALENFDLAQ
jgi:hypothetical protein